MGGRFDIIVVGLGPTGAVLANLLGLCGVSVLVLDRFRAPYPLPRAVHFDDEVMRVFQTIGVAGDVGNIVRVNVGMRFVDPAGKLLLDWPRPQEIGPQGWHASYRFHQPDLERILRAALENRATVEVGSGMEVIGVSDRGDDVEVACSDRETGNRSTVSAAYAVGCDGANSIVRKAMGVTETDLGFNERWLVADLLLKTAKPELGDHTVQYCDFRRPATYARGPGNRRRWEIAVRDDEEADRICKPDNVWRLLKRWISPDEAEIERAAVYTFQSIVADQWRSGRLLIAGDAAHRTPPFMGQGMCAGIRDAANLAWKLALAVTGRAPEAILDSYGSERGPHAREYVETAMRLGGLINASTTEADLDAAFRQSDGTMRMNSISPRLGPGLWSGNNDHSGRLFPQPATGGGARLDDVAGYAPALVVDSAFWRQAPAEVRNRALAAKLCVVETAGSPEVGASLAAFGARAVIVTPDRYVAGMAASQETLAGLLAAFIPSPLG